MSVSIKVKYDQKKYNEILGEAKRIANSISDLKPVWEKWEKYYLTETVPSIFDTRGKVLGEQWKKYNPQYLKWKQKNHPGKQMLIISGKMKEAATGGTGYFSKKEKKNLEIGLRGPIYWQVHQESKKRKRPFMWGEGGKLPPRAIKELINIMRDHVIKRK